MMSVFAADIMKSEKKRDAEKRRGRNTRLPPPSPPSPRLGAQVVPGRIINLLVVVTVQLLLALGSAPGVDAACAINPDASGNVEIPVANTTVAENAFNGCLCTSSFHGNEVWL